MFFIVPFLVSVVLDYIDSSKMVVIIVFVILVTSNLLDITVMITRTCILKSIWSSCCSIKTWGTSVSLSLSTQCPPQHDRQRGEIKTRGGKKMRREEIPSLSLMFPCHLDLSLAVTVATLTHTKT